jgi:hypothetical protein
MALDRLMADPTSIAFGRAIFSISALLSPFLGNEFVKQTDYDLMARKSRLK